MPWRISRQLYKTRHWAGHIHWDKPWECQDLREQLKTEEYMLLTSQSKKLRHIHYLDFRPNRVVFSVLCPSKDHSFKDNQMVSHSTSFRPFQLFPQSIINRDGVICTHAHRTCNSWASVSPWEGNKTNSIFRNSAFECLKNVQMPNQLCRLRCNRTPWLFAKEGVTNTQVNVYKGLT